MELIAVQDPTFSEVPEIKQFCPCALLVKECKTNTGLTFKVAQVITGEGRKIGLYPMGVKFAKKTCEVVSHRRIIHLTPNRACPPQT